VHLETFCDQMLSYESLSYHLILSHISSLAFLVGAVAKADREVVAAPEKHLRKTAVILWVIEEFGKS
jgi:hypothetical protein